MTEEPNWQAHNGASVERRKTNREFGAKLLATEAGVKFDSNNGGAHLIVVHNGGLIVDYWPGTGLWIPRRPERQKRGRGVHNLIQYIRACTTKITTQTAISTPPPSDADQPLEEANHQRITSGMSFSESYWSSQS